MIIGFDFLLISFEATIANWGGPNLVQVLYTLWNKSFNSKKIQPNLIPSKIIPIG